MFARIGQRFLHKTEHGGFRVGGQPVRLRFAGHMPGHHQMAIKQRIDVGISGTATRTEHIEQTLHITLRAFRFMANRAHRMPGDGKIMRARISAAIRLHNNRGERMGHHIMHIAGNARTLGQRRDMRLLCFPGHDGSIAFAHGRERGLARTLPQGHDDNAQHARFDERRLHADVSEHLGPAVDGAACPHDAGDRRACGHRDGIGQPAVADDARTGGRSGEQRTHVERHRPDRRRDQSHDERRDDEPPGMSGIAVQNHRIHHDKGVEIEIRDRRAEHKMRDGQRHEQPGRRLRAIPAQHQRHEDRQRPQRHRRLSCGKQYAARRIRAGDAVERHTTGDQHRGEQRVP